MTPRLKLLPSMTLSGIVSIDNIISTYYLSMYASKSVVEGVVNF